MLAVLQRPAETLYTQAHPQLSPLAWHVGHALQVERYWLCEQLMGEPEDAVARAIYFPEYTPKPARAAQLPDLPTLQASLHTQAAELRSAWQRAPARHGAISSGYLHAFVTQHYAQHLETVAMADYAQRVAADKALQCLQFDDASAPCDMEYAELPATEMELGRLQDCASAAPYDNELGVHCVQVPAQQIATHPVTVGQWLAFMADHGYQRPALWDAEGWAWREQHAVTAPYGWVRHGQQVLICPAWRDATRYTSPVCGISRHEALAYARWAGAELPHEHTWLAAKAAGLLQQTGQVWEWCSNALYTYPGFVAFPYQRYTLPWCDGQHWVLKGGSVLTRAPIRRDHFRNFYDAGQRHVFAGARLVRSG